jgi:hypothetical protein
MTTLTSIQTTEFTVDIVIVMNSVVACDLLQYIEEWFGYFAEIEVYEDPENSEFYQHTFSASSTDSIKILQFLEAVVIDYPECAIARVYSNKQYSCS